MITLLDRCASLRRGAAEYPRALERLGTDAPGVLTTCGVTALLRLPLTALFASVRLPGEALLAAFDLARSLRDAGVPVIGGFQSPVERECLDLLLRGRQPVVVCPARGIDGMRAPPDWRRALDDGRLLVVSPFPAARRRTTAGMADARNRMVAALAERIVIAHATPAGRVYGLAREAVRWRKRVLCPDMAANHDLLLLGAEPIGPPTISDL